MSRLSSEIGVRSQALEWFRSYLSDRYQSVQVKDEASDRVLLLFGVPQGSVLGPVAFLIYMCPVFNIAKLHGIIMHQYADDTQLYLAFDFKKQEEAMAKMEACVNDIRLWMKLNKLQLNEDKTELLVIAPARQAHKVRINSIKIGDSVVNASQSAKNLGTTFDKTMSLDQHVSSLVKSCNFQLRSIGKARRFLTTDATEKVIHAFISSRLDCGNSLLYGLPDYQISRLQRVQNTAARILTRTKKFEHITPILKSLHWLPVSKRIEYKILTLTFKCLQEEDEAPGYLKELITKYEPRTEMTLRSFDKKLLVDPRTNLVTYGDRSFYKAAPTLWNALPLDIRQSDSLGCFQTKLKSYLFNKG